MSCVQAPHARDWVGVWVDNMGTGLMVTEGTRDANGVFTGVGAVPDPVSGTFGTVKERDWTAPNGVRHFEMYDTTPDGKEFRTMEILYTRK